MKKSVLFVLILVLIVTCETNAEIITYSDDYVTFQYDDEMIGEVAIVKNSNWIMYHVSLDVKRNEPSVYGSVRFFSNNDKKDMVKEFSEAREEENSVYEPVEGSENERNIISKKDGYIQNQKLIMGANDQYAIISSHSDSNKYADLFCDTLEISDVFFDSGIVFDEESDYDTISIFHNGIYSDQALAYATKALETCEKYLNMEISGEEAAEIFSELERRCESYYKESDYISDSDIYYAVFNEDYYFEYGKDSEVIKTRDNLKSILNQ